MNSLLLRSLNLTYKVKGYLQFFLDPSVWWEGWIVGYEKRDEDTQTEEVMYAAPNIQEWLVV